MIPLPHARPDPKTVMIKLSHAITAHPTVFRAQWYRCAFTFITRSSRAVLNDSIRFVGVNIINNFSRTFRVRSRHVPGIGPTHPRVRHRIRDEEPPERHSHRRDARCEIIHRSSQQDATERVRDADERERNHPTASQRDVSRRVFVRRVARGAPGESRGDAGDVSGHGCDVSSLCL